jgi:hypothetical protein
VTLRQTTITAIADLCALAERLQVTPREQFDGDHVADQIWAITATLEVDEETDDDNTGGPVLLIRMHREGLLKFELTSGDRS